MNPIPQLGAVDKVDDDSFHNIICPYPSTHSCILKLSWTLFPDTSCSIVCTAQEFGLKHMRSQRFCILSLEQFFSKRN